MSRRRADNSELVALAVWRVWLAPVPWSRVGNGVARLPSLYALAKDLTAPSGQAGKAATSILAGRSAARIRDLLRPHRKTIEFPGLGVTLEAKKLARRLGLDAEDGGRLGPTLTEFFREKERLDPFIRWIKALGDPLCQIAGLPHPEIMAIEREVKRLLERHLDPE